MESQPNQRVCVCVSVGAGGAAALLQMLSLSCSVQQTFGAIGGLQ